LGIRIMTKKITMKQFGAVTATAIALVFSAAMPANAAPISGLFSTGVDGAGAALGNGATDTHYSIVSPAQQGIVINQASIPGSWVANSLTSRWIWETAAGTPISVDRTFRTTFDLTGLDAATASIAGGWSTDNSGLDILINGISTSQTCGGFSAVCGFSVASGFLSGINTLDFVVRDVGGIAGFLVSSLNGTADESATEVPEPGLVAIFGLGLIGLGLARRRNTRRA
jgi:hypothetical protein